MTFNQTDSIGLNARSFLRECLRELEMYTAMSVSHVLTMYFRITRNPLRVISSSAIFVSQAAFYSLKDMKVIV